MHAYKEVYTHTHGFVGSSKTTPRVVVDGCVKEEGSAVVLLLEAIDVDAIDVDAMDAGGDMGGKVDAP